LKSYNYESKDNINIGFAESIIVVMYNF